MNIRKKLTFLLTLVTLLSILFIVLFVSNLIKKEMMKSFEKQVKITEDFEDNIIIAYEAKSLNYARLINQDPEMGKAAEYADLGNPDDLRHKLSGVYKKLDLTILEVTNTEGRVLYSANKPDKFDDMIQGNALKDSLAGKVTVDIFRDKTGYSIKAFAPLGFAGFTATQDETGEIKNIKGVIITGFFLDNKFAEIIKRFSNTEFSVISMDGEIVASSYEGLRHTKIDLEILTRVEDLKDIINKETEIDGEKYFASYRPIVNNIDETIGLFMTSVSKADMISARRGMFFNLFLFAIFACAMAGIIGFFTSKRISVPIRNLVDWARRLSAGDLTLEKIKIRNDEIGELNDSYRAVVNSFQEVASVCEAISDGDFSRSLEIKSDKDVLGKSVNKMINTLRAVTAENEKQNWLKTGQTELNDRMRGEQDIPTLSRNIISYIATYLNTQIGALYRTDEDKDDLLRLIGSYAYTKQKNLSDEYRFGQGLTGQAALEKKSILINNVPDSYIKIHSGLGEASPRNIMIVPILYEGKVKGVIELGSFYEITDLQLDFLREVTENIAISLNSAQSRFSMKELLKETRRQAEELETQQEELRQTNEELEEQTQILEKQKEDIKKKNTELEKSRQVVEEKAKELEISSKYKSQFLANMSHELRTPLNSLLLLSRLLMENKDSNLTDKQVEFARTINNAGYDLLNLINDILDLSKIEAGKMELNFDNLEIDDFLSNIEQNFRHMAQEKGLSLKVDKADELPTHIRTDRQRVEQIVKNFLSNAFKFTAKGSITISIHCPGADVDLSNSGLDPSSAIAIAVSDTGIGIPKEKQKSIFEAFQQVDGTTSRQYGGTGLGLSISRELAKLLGGEIQLQGIEGKGSTFTLYLPEVMEQADKVEVQLSVSHQGNDAAIHKNDMPTGDKPAPKNISSDKPFELEDIRDDRRNITHGDKTILIIEDDPKFAKILYELALEKGFKGIIAGDGEAGLHLADYYKPSAIILDISLPRMDGWTVMERLKDNPETRHIPVHFMSVFDSSLEAMKMGSIGYLTKPVSMEKLNEAFKKIEETISVTMKSLLIVEENEKERNSIVELIGSKDIIITVVGTCQEAYELLKSTSFGCMILDPGLPDMSGFELLKKIRNDKTIPYLPIIIYTGKELSEEEDAKLRKHAESIVIKGIRSPERLLDETVLFLHRVETNLPEEKKKMLRMTYDKETVLKDKKILLVDDDMRNVFALSSILEERGTKVLIGKNGKEALECLDKIPDINLVLMDIMMPEMDGYEATREIRKQERFKKLPIIVFTAKAMRGDRKKCIDAGASDYLAKPIDTDKLLSLLRVWLYQ